MLELRTTPDVESGIVYVEYREDGRQFLEYTPGDGSTYRVIFLPMGGFSEDTCHRFGISPRWENVMVTLANSPANVKSMITHRGATIHWKRVEEKLGVGKASAITLAELFAYVLDGKALSSEEAQRRASEGAL